MADRVGFVLEVEPDRIDEYVTAHAEVWPEMLTALKGAGIRNYSIFRAGTRVFGYFEVDDRAAAERYLARQPVCARLAGPDGRFPGAARRRFRAGAARRDLSARLRLGGRAPRQMLRTWCAQETIAFGPGDRRIYGANSATCNSAGIWTNARL